MARAKASRDEEAMRSVLLRQTDAPDEDVRMEKIERLRAAIADGTYSVSAEALADKIIEHMSDPAIAHVSEDKP